MKILIEESTLRQALAVLEDRAFTDTDCESITALRTALEQPAESEPVAWHGITGDYGFPFLSFQEQPGMTPLYTHPAPAVPNVDCVTCANRGGVYGLSQESNCDHCLWQGHWHKKDLFSEPKPEDV